MNKRPKIIGVVPAAIGTHYQPDDKPYAIVAWIIYSDAPPIAVSRDFGPLINGEKIYVPDDFWIKGSVDTSQ